jgi:hypothetical protein
MTRQSDLSHGLGSRLVALLREGQLWKNEESANNETDAENASERITHTILHGPLLRSGLL